MRQSKVGPEWLDLSQHVLPRGNSKKVLPEGAKISPHTIGRSSKVGDIKHEIRRKKNKNSGTKR
jgi:hypothetical protein